MNRMLLPRLHKDEKEGQDEVETRVFPVGMGNEFRFIRVDLDSDGELLLDTIRPVEWEDLSDSDIEFVKQFFPEHPVEDNTSAD